MESEEERLKLLELHIKQGESQTVEFKEGVPDSVRKLAENIASFATSNQGTVYLGIRNSGGIVGLNEAKAPQSRDELQRRIIGIIAMIEPQIRVDIEFIKKDLKNIVRITVPKGSEPLYYVGSIPYLRDLSTSRPARPNEVTELHQKYFSNRIVSLSENQQERFLQDLLVPLADVKLALSDIENHFSNPNLSQLQNDLGSSGQTLLRLSVKPPAKSLNFDEKLKHAALKLSDMRAYQFYIGRSYYDTFIEMGKDVLQLIQPIIQQLKKEINIVHSKIEFSEMLRSAIEELRVNWDLGKRRRDDVSELEKLKDSFRTLAYRFNRLAILPESEKYQIQADLFEIAKRLRAVSTPLVFGPYTLGFDNIIHITPAVETCIKIGESLIDHINKQ